jgi:hypothetical protein
MKKRTGGFAQKGIKPLPQGIPAWTGSEDQLLCPAVAINEQQSKTGRRCPEAYFP